MSPPAASATVRGRRRGRDGLRLGDALVDHPQQPGGVGIEPARAELERLPPGQGRQAGWQFRGQRHPGPVDQDRDDEVLLARALFPSGEREKLQVW